MRHSLGSNGTFATLHSASAFFEIQTIAMAVPEALFALLELNVGVTRSSNGSALE